MATSIELRAQRAQVWDRMQQIVDGAEAEGRNLTAEENTNFAAADQEQRGIGERIARTEMLENTRASDATDGGSRLIVPPSAGLVAGMDGGQRRPWEEPEYIQAVHNYMRRPPSSSMQFEGAALLQKYQNVMMTTTGAAGGYTIPPLFQAGVEAAMLWYGGMRSVAEIITTDSGADLPFVTGDDTGNVGAILAEGATIGTQDTTFATKFLKAFMYTSQVIKVSYQLLQDTGFNLEGYISRIAGERLARIQNTHFTSGAGANQPSGILGDTFLGVTAAATGAVTYEELLDLEHSVDRAYRQGARYMFNDTTLRELRKLKDGNGAYLWTMGTTAGEPDRFNGYPYTINNDMPAMATGNIAIIFGDLSRYKIRDVRGFTLVRLDEKYAEELQVGFFVFSRHDGGLIDAGTHPVKHLVMA